MTVYFICPVGDETRVKIGHTSDLGTRLQVLGNEFENGVELVASCDGDAATERAFHAIFAPDWIEGEWYRRSAFMDRMLDPLRASVVGRRIWGRLRAISDLPVSPIDQDKEIARALLHSLMGRYGAMPVAQAQRHVFEDLKHVNPAWTQRRVRAIWERSARRIDHFEVRDLEAALRSQAEAARA